MRTNSLPDGGVSPADSGLTHVRQTHLACADDAGWLGGLWYGPARDNRWGALDAPLLGTSRQGDAWYHAGPAVNGTHGRVRWRQSGPWLFGLLQVDEATTTHGETDLESLSHAAYGELFSCLDHAQQGGWHLLRVWNYLPRINACEGTASLERYRQFNAGRQLAFEAHGRDSLAGSPAACAIGTASGPICIYFLAGRRPATPLENPRQVPAYHYPTEFGPRSPTFSRACLISPVPGQCTLLISGTASIVGHQSLHIGDVAAQTQETLRNLQAVIDAAHQRCSARFSLPTLTCTVYIRHAKDAEQVMGSLVETLGAQAPALRNIVTLEADICRAELLVEIEAHTTAPGHLGDAA